MEPFVFTIRIIALNHFICCFFTTKAIFSFLLINGFYILFVIMILIFRPCMICICYGILILHKNHSSSPTFFGFFEWRFGNTFSTTWCEADSSFCRIYTLKCLLCSNPFSFLIKVLFHRLLSDRCRNKMTTDYSAILKSLCHHYSQFFVSYIICYLNIERFGVSH